MRCRKVDEQKTRETLVTMAALFAGIGLAGVLAGAMIAGPLLCGAAFGESLLGPLNEAQHVTHA